MSRDTLKLLIAVRLKELELEKEFWERRQFPPIDALKLIYFKIQELTKALLLAEKGELNL